MIAPRISWEEMDRQIAADVGEFRKIKSGCHVALLGTTRGGKTTVVTGGGNPDLGILRHWEDVLVLDTTGDPGPISNYGKPVNRFQPIRGHRRLTITDMSQKSKESVYRWIQKAVAQGHVAIYADELRQLTEKKYLGLGPVMDYLWLFTAKKDVSLIGGTQAPRWIPGAFYDQSKMHLLFKTRDDRSMKRLAEISGDTATIKETMPGLQRWEFMYVGLDGDVTVSKFQMPKKGGEKPPEKRVRIYHPASTHPV
jgi:hypothetical protein